MLLLVGFVLSFSVRASTFSESVIVFGGEASYPPFEWLDERTPSGFNIDLGNALAESGGLRAEHRLGDWPEAIRGLKSGAVDVVAMFHSEGREQHFRFSKPFAFVNHAIFGLPDAPRVTSIDDLGPTSRLAVEQLSYAHLRLAETDHPAQLQTVPSTVEALEAVLERRADYAILSAPAASYLIESRGWPLISVGSPLWPAEYAFAVRKDREDLVAWLNEQLEAVVRSGRFREIQTHWEARMMPTHPSSRWLTIAAPPLAAVVLLGGWWLWSMRRAGIKHAALLDDESRLRIQAESKLSWASDHNTDTGVPNQSRFMRMAADYLGNHGGEGRKFVVAALKLAELEKTIRTHGHDAGLDLVRRFAERISAANFPAFGQIGRDVFVIFGERARIDGEFRGQISGADTVIMQAPYPRIFGGAATWPQHGETVPELLRRAETALSKAVQRRTGWVDYRPVMEPKAADLELVSRFRRQGANLIYPVFQPQIDLDTGDVIGAEALARFVPSGNGEVSPGVFIPLLEDAGLISQVTRRMVLEAVRVAASLRDKGYPCPISVNVTGNDILGWKLSRTITRALNEYQGNATDLKLELTETSVIDRPELLQWKMRRLVKEGINFSVDDFGTGYSSLAYLSDFPVREIKIDQSFIRDMMKQDKIMSIVTSTISMGRELRMLVVAEGVETEESLNVLRQAGCDRAQGYVISRPLAEPDFVDFVLRRARPAATRKMDGKVTSFRSRKGKPL